MQRKVPCLERFSIFATIECEVYGNFCVETKRSYGPTSKCLRKCNDIWIKMLSVLSTLCFYCKYLNFSKIIVVI